MPHFSKKIFHQQFLTQPQGKKTQNQKPIKLPLSIGKNQGSQVTTGPLSLGKPVLPA